MPRIFSPKVYFLEISLFTRYSVPPPSLLILRVPACWGVIFEVECFGVGVLVLTLSFIWHSPIVVADYTIIAL